MDSANHRPELAWVEANQRYLSAAARVIEKRLEAAARGVDFDEAGIGRQASRGLQEAADAMPGPCALERLRRLFSLTPFQTDVLMLAAAVELFSATGTACAQLLGDPRARHATFGIALSALPSSHWSALAPDAPLRRWRLIEVQAGGLTDAPIRIDERILHELVGVPYLDERLRGVVDMPKIAAVPPRYRGAEDEVVRCLGGPSSPAVVLSGGNAESRMAVACAALRSSGVLPLVVRAAELPTPSVEREHFLMLVRRELLLAEAGLIIEIDAADTPDKLAVVRMLATTVRGPIVVVTDSDEGPIPRTVVHVELPALDATDQHALWEEAIGPASAQMEATIKDLANEFRLTPQEIARAGQEWRCRVEAGEEADDKVEHPLRRRVRLTGQSSFRGLAQVIVPRVSVDDLVLPQAQADTIRQIESHVRLRGVVLDGWGFARREARGHGIAALFHGPSGTGKTMAAEVIAGALGLDLVRADLSQLVSKYIGETEKNLRRIFDAADRGGVVLLFDEADALFGKRSEVKDSHDRYANIEVGYLLQRLEAFRGLAVLTTNLRQSMDAAFVRRLRFMVEFPFPGEPERKEIWRRALPPELPRESVDLDRLARLQAAGGSIRNIALHAAFLAAAETVPLRMRHLQRAARDEFARAERAMIGTEIGAWA